MQDAPYSDNKTLAKRTIPEKVLKERAYEIDINRRYDEYQRALANMVSKFWLENRIRSDSDNHRGSKCQWTTSWRITEPSN